LRFPSEIDARDAPAAVNVAFELSLTYMESVRAAPAAGGGKRTDLLTLPVSGKSALSPIPNPFESVTEH